MKYYGDFLVSKTVRCRFNTVNSSGAPTTLTSGAVTISRDGSDVTPSGGVTLNVDAGTVTGRHTLVIDMSVDTTTFTAGSEYSARLSGSSAVGAQSVVGVVVGEWSVENRSVTVDANGRVQVQSGTGAGQISLSSGIVSANTTQLAGQTVTAAAGVTFPSSVASPTNITGGTITTVTTTTNLTNLPSIPANWLTSTGIAASALNGKGDWLLSSGYTAPPSTASIATAVWTDTTAGDFTTATSPGKIIFTQLGGAFTTTSSSVFSTASLANAPTGGSAPTVSQIATAVWQDATAGDFTVASSIGKALYVANVAPGGAGGHFIAGSNAATSITTALTANVIGNVTGNLSGSVGSVTAAVTANVTQWAGNAVAATNVNGVPIVDVKYVLGSLASVSNGTAQAGTSTSITLAAGEPSTTDFYKGRQVTIVAGTAVGQMRFITAYNGSTKVATVHRAWDTTPDSTSQYSIDGLAEVNVSQFAGSNVALDANNLPNVNAKDWNGTAITTSVPNSASVTVAGYAAGQDPATLVLDVAASGHNTASTIGAKINSAGSSSDPLANAASTYTTSGTIGYVINHSLGNTGATVATNSDKTGYSLSVTPPTAAQIASVILTTPSNLLSTDSSGRVLLQPTQAGVTIPTVTTVTNQLTAAAIATATLTSTTAGDFAVNGSPGHILVTQLGGAFTGTGSVYTSAALANAPTGGGGGPTAAQIATAILTDTTSGDFTVDGSPGKIIKTQLGGAFTTASSSVFTAPSLANAPGVGGGTINANVVQFAGVTTYAYDGVLAGATASTVTLPATDAAGNAIPDDGRYQFMQFYVAGGTGAGQTVSITTRTQTARQYTILASTCPTPLDATSQYVMRASNISEQDMTAIVPLNSPVGSVGESWLAARAQGFGKWTWPAGSTALTLYGPDGTTPVHVLNLDSATAPRNRT